MSGNADTIKDFLVSLGFDIDQAGANKFEAVLKGVTANVLKVGAVVEGAALSIVGFTTQIANGLDKIYWASQRTGASVQGIKALGYAASQTGASAESAMSSLEGLAGFMGLMPQETRNYIPKVMSNMPTSAPVIQQETNINIHGVSDPREAARLSAERQGSVNSVLTQQLITRNS